MTEKRFTFNLTLGEDEHKGLIFYNGQVMTTIEVAHMLNKQDNRIKELYDENEKLKEKIRRQLTENKRLHRDWDKLYDLCLDKGCTEDEIIKEMER